MFFLIKNWVLKQLLGKTGDDADNSKTRFVLSRVQAIIVDTSHSAGVFFLLLSVLTVSIINMDNYKIQISVLPDYGLLIVNTFRLQICFFLVE